MSLLFSKVAEADEEDDDDEEEEEEEEEASDDEDFGKGTDCTHSSKSCLTNLFTDFCKNQNSI